MKKLLIIILFTFLSAFYAAPVSAVVTPVKKTDFKEFPVQTLTANSVVVIDKASGEVLFSHNYNLEWPAASLTKLMTGVIFLEQNPDFLTRASIIATDEVGGGRLVVPSGSLMLIKDIFYSAIAGSANNCAMAMMRLSGMDSRRFVDIMNLRARVIGMKNTKYYEPSGMDPRNTTTAEDLALLSKYAFSNSQIRHAATTFWYKFNVISPALAKSIKNTNDLLIYDPDLYITGGKTGYLEESQYNLVIQTKHMRETRPELIVVVLGADTRKASFNEAKALALWMWDNYKW
ncbi:MAG: hypothetical protein PHW53_03575 [Patescibacteria group bacterium]|nr:hypothetical protein [Patescibacteria group bacterium]